jgi:hypothetical protein
MNLTGAISAGQNARAEEVGQSQHNWSERAVESSTHCAAPARPKSDATATGILSAACSPVWSACWPA